jgi:dynein heavy chain 2
MLEILGQAQKASVIQSHLKKMFAGIDRVQLSKDERMIEAMVSSGTHARGVRTKLS